MKAVDTPGGHPRARPTPAIARAAERWLLPAVALIALACHLPVLDRGFALFDEGYFLALADDVNRGRVIYRDTYLDAPLPGAIYLMAAWLRFVGGTVWHSRLFVLVIAVLLIVLATRIGRELLPLGWTAALAVLLVCYRFWAFPHWQLAHYASTAVFFVTVGVALTAAWLRSERTTTLVAAGVACGIGIASKQDYGLAVSGALGLVLLLRPFLHPRAPLTAPALAFVAGIATILAPGLAYFAWHGAIRHLVNQAILVPFRGAASGFYPGLPPLRPLLAQDPVLRAGIVSYLPAILGALRWDDIHRSWWWQATPVWDVGLKALFYLPLGTFLAALVSWGPGMIRRARRAEGRPVDERRLLLLAWSGGFLLAFNRPRDWAHLVMVYPPALVLATVLLAGGVRRLPWLVRRAVTASLIVALAGFAIYTASVAERMRREFTWPLASPRAGIRVDPHNGPVVDDVVAWIARTARPGAPVPVWPTQPMINFLADRETAGGFLLVWPFQEADRDERIIADLERRQIETVVYSLSQIGVLRDLPDNAPRLFSYLVRHFEIDAVFAREPQGTLLVGLRRRRPPTGTPVPVDGAADAGFTRLEWPFAEVLAQPSAGATPQVARLRVHVPADAPMLAFRYGVNPAAWGNPSVGPLTFRLTPDDGPTFEARLDPARVLADRRWASGRIDLTAFAGRDVTLAFTITGPDGARGLVGGWSELRFVGDAGATS